MDDEQIEFWLMRVGSGDRAALRSLFDAVAPGMAATLAAKGVGKPAAEGAIAATFSQLWNGDYAQALRPGQSLMDWLISLAVNHAPRPAADQADPIIVSDHLWKKVARQAFPENGWNILKRTDVLFGIAAAIVWAVIIRFMIP